MIKFIVLRGSAYFLSDRAPRCPMPITTATTFEFKRTPRELFTGREEGNLARCLLHSKPCWVNCGLNCPAKHELESALAAVTQQNSTATL
jgi:hypothetical protein